MADSDASKDKSNSSSFEDLSKTAAAELKDLPADEPRQPHPQPPLQSETASSPSSDPDATEMSSALGLNAETLVDDVIDVIGTGQLLKRILTRGTGNTQPQRGDLCTITYIGRLAECGSVVEQRTAAIVQIGDVELVQGLDMALPLMLVGERAEVTCDARFAYGAQALNITDPAVAAAAQAAGLQRSVPPNAKITYVVELHDCADEPEIAEQPFEQRRDRGVSKRERGNFWYTRGDFNLAIQLYRRALEYLNDNGPGVEGVAATPDEVAITEAQLRELLEVRIKVYNNLAAAQMKIAAYDTALQSVDQVLRCEPDNVKALFRKGKILESKGDAGAAIPVLQRGATLDPESRAIQQLLAKCIMKARRDERQEKDFYRKMMGQAQRADEKRQQQRQAGGAQSQVGGQLNESGREVPKVSSEEGEFID